MAPMIDWHGQFLVRERMEGRRTRGIAITCAATHRLLMYVILQASWKNSPQDEDQPGQRIMYSQSLDGVSWTPTDGGWQCT
jgi:hypothetical protein